VHRMPGMRLAQIGMSEENMEEKYINRYHSFCDSLSSLERARERDPEDEFVLSGTASKFSLTLDIVQFRERAGTYMDKMKMEKDL